MQFYQRVRSLLDDEATVLDFGAGRGVSHIDDDVPYRKNLKTIKGHVKEVIGADVDPVVMTNPSLDRAVHIGPNGEIPLHDASIDLILSDWTFEHIPDPVSTSHELDRVLKPGGRICARTPNRYGYIALSNQLIPDSLRRRALKSAQPHRKEEDVFPAVYRMNTKSDLLKFFPSERFKHFVYTWDSSPSYYFGSRFMFSFWSTIHWLSPPAFRTVLMIFIQKRGNLP
ncbi:methyltransferase domain-containing protein [Microvirga sp. TS319]|uniref:class I SAM-dependent methyltransferase n=1 Tax=Microvirga sp. TS319 TaxID=3241165 RepID=UPI00351A924C